MVAGTASMGGPNIPSAIVTVMQAMYTQVGPTGPTGATGSIGATGSTGATGPTGPTGIGYSSVVSTSTVTVGASGVTGWTVPYTGAFKIGDFVRVSEAVSPSLPTAYMEGTVTAGTVTNNNIYIDVVNSSGSGTFSSWKFSAAGIKGATGPTGATGPSGVPGSNGVTSLTGGTGVSVSSSTGAVTASIGQSVATTANPTFGNITASGSGDTSIKINSTSGYAIQYFAINGTNRWHYEVTPSYQSWGLVETGIAQRMTVNAGTGNATFTGAVTASGAPSVYAVRTADLSYNNSSQNIPIRYDNAVINVGSTYNAATGLLTAPLAGDYLIECGVYNAANVDVSQLWIVKNGVRGVSIMLSSAGGSGNVAGSGIERLAVGDTLGMAAWFGGASVTITANIFHTFLRIRYLG